MLLEIYFEPFKHKRTSQIVADHFCSQGISSLGIDLLASTRKALLMETLPEQNRPFGTFFSFKEKLTPQIFPLLASQPHVPAETSTHLACCSVTARKITASLNNGNGVTETSSPGTKHSWNTYMAKKDHIKDLCEPWIHHTSQVFP